MRMNEVMARVKVIIIVPVHENKKDVPCLITTWGNFFFSFVTVSCKSFDPPEIKQTRLDRSNSSTFGF